MISKPLEKPSSLCGKCKELGSECFCKCHTDPLIESYHEYIHYMPVGKVEDVTEFEDDGLIKKYD